MFPCDSGERVAMSNNYAGLRRDLVEEDGAAKRCADRLLAVREVAYCVVPGVSISSGCAVSRA